MTPADLQAARKRLGLSQKGLAEALRMGKQAGRTVRRWESGEIEIPGPVEVAVELMLERLCPACKGSGRRVVQHYVESHESDGVHHYPSLKDIVPCKACGGSGVANLGWQSEVG